MIGNIINRVLKIVLALSLVIVVGCAEQSVSFTSEQVSASKVTESAKPTDNSSSNSINNPANSQPKVSQSVNSPFPNLPRLNGSATVEMKLKYGTVTIEVDGIDAPITAGNFVDLVKRGVYNNLTFHRVIREPSPFVAQGGDPLGNGTGSFIDPATSQPRLIPLEITKAYTPKEGFIPKPEYSNPLKPDDRVQLRHTRGAVAMARSQSPDSASSQFYIALADINFLDGSYAVFGYVTSGMDVVDKIKLGDRIESMTVTKGIENLKTVR
ncbi:peptidyl-prolyl cis-trans isomerase (rotamase) - cyclophilin family [Synechococcus sp. PCC 7502]|uniref:peptidylprolyl isomerase n=1 Tax=Synechococcus sp. PCC 7502 TaxID=1173263 RepID=UPI00029FC68C|nr:peptidylprolyl isomerase [Synechococcus sp. PCC 7502]AFY75111.1 peptidyl-prolyl cis-trans isomerase (rotamase) - cyclophilin family [Synechococcus sp. PCC 7502]